MHFTNKQINEPHRHDDPSQSIGKTRLTVLGTLDHATTAGFLCLLALSSLMIVNSSCSHSQGLTADTPLCKGGSLSVQSWLAIVGIEFSLLTVVLLPRLGKLLVSKSLTARVSGSRGIALASILNSQSSAPIKTQAKHGLKTVFGLRVLIAIVVAFLSVSYKFSFVRVAMQDSVGIEGSEVIALGDTDNWRSFASKIVLQSLGGDRMSYWVKEISPYKPHTEQLINGTVKACYPTMYLRILAIAEDYTDEDWYNTSPLVKSTPYRNGTRFHDLNHTQLADVTSENGALKVYQAGMLDIDSRGVGYAYGTTFTTQRCRGWVSWSEWSYTDYRIEEPVEIGCENQTFDFDTWRVSKDGILGVNLANASLATLDLNFWNAGDVAQLIAGVFIAPKSIQDQEWSYDELVDQPPQCKDLYGSNPVVIEGLIANRGTGMTQLGIGLQAVVIGLCVLALVLLAWPSLPLLSEWPAQWIGLITTIDRAAVLRALDGTSAGNGRVGKTVNVWLASEPVGEDVDTTPGPGMLRLRLSDTGSAVSWGKGHL